MQCCDFKKYSSNHVLKVYKAPNQTVAKQKQRIILKTCKQQPFYRKILCTSSENVCTECIFNRIKLPEIQDKHIISFLITQREASLQKMQLGYYTKLWILKWNDNLVQIKLISNKINKWMNK